jgi:hypothetical protein
MKKPDKTPKEKTVLPKTTIPSLVTKPAPVKARPTLTGSLNASSITTPFRYQAGINYESWTMGRPPMNISADLSFISRYFSLVKTFHCAAVGTSNPAIPEMDPTQQNVITAITATPNMQLIMGTNSNALAQGGYGTAWSAGLMTTSAYTDAWVKMVIDAFGSKAATLKYLACICLGNEVDANGPPSSDSHFTDYYTTWIPAAFTNLVKSLNKQGLGSIPVTSIIANYPLGTPGSNIVASQVTAFINSHWIATWNGNKPFVFFNQYTPDNGQSTNFNAVSAYFNQVAAKLNNAPQVFVGETGYSAEFGAANQQTVITAMFSWLASQQGGGARSIPLCVFQAFDHSAKPPGQQQMGLFQCSSSGVYSVKSGITIPAWVNTPIS